MQPHRLTIIFLLLIATGIQAQLLPLSPWAVEAVNPLPADTVRFTGVRPMLSPAALPTSSWLYRATHVADTVAEFPKRLLQNHLLQYKEEGLELFVDPLLEFTTGGSNEKEERLYRSTRGLRLSAKAGQRFFLYSDFREQQARFPAFTDSIINRNQRVVPGEGMARGFGSGGYDFARSTALLTYAAPHIEATLGYGKNFLGEGYRSLLLSDNASSYPYLRVQAAYKKLRYTVWYTQLANPRYRIDGRYQRKWATMHYAALQLGKRWQLGLFDAVVWQSEDSLQRRGFELSYLNPLLFIRPAEFAQGSPDNSLFGFTAKFQAGRQTFLYGQLMLDDLNIGETRRNKQQHLNNKYGVQVGLWTAAPVVPGLSYRLEFNAVRPYSYGHRKPLQNYSHFNEALAHPLGANFYEVVNQLHYDHRGWYAAVHHTQAVRGESYDGHNYGDDLWGGEAGLPPLGHTMLQGRRTNISYMGVQFGRIINPAMNLRLQVDAGRYGRTNDVTKQGEGFFSVGITSF